MTNLYLTSLALLALQAAAFCPPSLTSSRRLPFALRATDADVDDPFEAYQPGSSLAVKELKAGEGEPSADGDVLTVAYTGRILGDPKQFDSSEGWNFKMGGGNVMPGFDQGLVGAKLGSKRIIRIPPVLAYGETGRGSVIPPNSDLEFDVEVKKIGRGLAGEVTLFGEQKFISIVGLLAFMGAVPFVTPYIDKVMSALS